MTSGYNFVFSHVVCRRISCASCFNSIAIGSVLIGFDWFRQQFGIADVEIIDYLSRVLFRIVVTPKVRSFRESQGVMKVFKDCQSLHGSIASALPNRVPLLPHARPTDECVNVAYRNQLGIYMHGLANDLQISFTICFDEVFQFSYNYKGSCGPQKCQHKMPRFDDGAVPFHGTIAGEDNCDLKHSSALDEDASDSFMFDPLTICDRLLRFRFQTHQVPQHMDRTNLKQGLFFSTEGTIRMQ